jgi:type IV fimbrial biogenesis protein FimT
VRALPTFRLSALHRRRGFTLIELMVVVVIIAILAAIAVPLFAARFTERRVQQSAQRVAELYRGARARALGRGAAIVVAKTGTTFQVLEGVQGSTLATAAGNATCGNLPTRGCITNNWGNVSTNSSIGTARVLSTFTLPTGTTADTVFASGTPATLNVCFSPAGHTWVKLDNNWTTQNWSAMSGAADLKVTNGGRLYDVIVLPNGSARLGK